MDIFLIKAPKMLAESSRASKRLLFRAAPV